MQEKAQKKEKSIVEEDEEYARQLQNELNEGWDDTRPSSEVRDPTAMIIRLPDTNRDFNAALFGAMVQEGFQKLYNAKGISDVVILLVDDKDSIQEKLYAHKMVLSVWSDVFCTLILEKEKEVSRRKKSKKTTDDDSPPRRLKLKIEIPSEDLANFRLMLQYMYTGEADFIDGKNVLPLIGLANHFGIHSLKEVCGSLLGELVDDDTLLYYLNICDTYTINSLESACGEHLAENFTDLVQESKLMDLKPSTWAQILKSDDLQIMSEEDLFEMVLKYSDRWKKDKAKREEVLSLLLPHVRFPFFSGRFLVEHVEQNSIAGHLPVVKDLLRETYKEKVYPGSVKNERTTPRAGFRFDPTGLHANLSITDDGLTAQAKGGGWSNVRCKENMTASHNYIEWKVVSGSTSSLMLGIVQGTSTNTGYAGQLANGWTYYSGGQIYHSGSTPAYGQSFTAGDKIGCLFNFETGTLTFFKNGKVSVTLSGNGLPVGKYTDNIFPVTCFSGYASVNLVQYATNPNGKKKRKTSILDPKKSSLQSTNTDRSLIRRFLKF
eukprot:TRINITY_DN273_c0_g1_i1.p1 TRINITY_DN273_c0_g1~~TRINITY_DN273_c0_g1_i1.p1  ORF type:complete len:548 (-),score=86.88 TRINITY_DN273_c0_g1_i1:52-1695(-)